jgi:hypothetical protein
VTSPRSVSRHLDWEGCFNARDLGGLPLDHAGGDAVRAPSREEDQGSMIERYLYERGTTITDVLLEALGSIDVEERLRAGGLVDEELAALRARLVR